MLVEKYGGKHHGYFLPGNDSDHLPRPSFSFPDIGKNGPDNMAVSLFSFPDIETYENYKKKVAEDEVCKAITKQFNKTKSFLSYERSFLNPVFK